MPKLGEERLIAAVCSVCTVGRTIITESTAFSSHPEPPVVLRSIWLDQVLALERSRSYRMMLQLELQNLEGLKVSGRCAVAVSGRILCSFEEHWRALFLFEHGVETHRNVSSLASVGMLYTTSFNQRNTASPTSF